MWSSSSWGGWGRGCLITTCQPAASYGNTARPRALSPPSPPLSPPPSPPSPLHRGQGSMESLDTTSARTPDAATRPRPPGLQSPLYRSPTRPLSIIWQVTTRRIHARHVHAYTRAHVHMCTCGHCPPFGWCIWLVTRCIPSPTPTTSPQPLTLILPLTPTTRANPNPPPNPNHPCALRRPPTAITATTCSGSTCPSGTCYTIQARGRPRPRQRARRRRWWRWPRCGSCGDGGGCDGGGGGGRGRGEWWRGCC